jgi:hypothetical protein
MTYRGFHKHIFSSAHRDALDVLIHKRKQPLLKYVEGKDYSVLPYVVPNPRLPTMTLKMCYGCNSAYYCKGYNKTHTCTKLKEHLDTMKQILAKEISVESEEPVVVPVSEDTSKLKTQIESLKKNLKSAEAIVDKSENVSQAMIELLQRLQENHKDIFREQMVQLRYSRMEVFSEMCEALEIEEDEL